MRLTPLAALLAVGCATYDTTFVTDKSDPGDTGCPDAQTWYEDRDGDGWGAGSGVTACEAPGEGWLTDGGDCDDANAAILPGADELCDGQDGDCDGTVDESPTDASTFWSDVDADGYGDPDNPVEACEAPEGAVDNADDCDDYDPNQHPGVEEICDGQDQDCDGDVDEEAVDASTRYADTDLDGWGVETPTAESCTQPEGYADNPDDCDDTDASLTDNCSGGPTTSVGTCTGTLYTWTETSPDTPELHIVGLYESDGGHGNPPGTTTITVDRETEMTLVLSSYEPVNWIVTTAPNTVLNEVILNGYNNHSATVPSGVPVTDLSGRGNYMVACGYAWPSSSGGCDTPGLVGGSEGFTGLNLASFTGCYHGTAFTIQ